MNSYNTKLIKLILSCLRLIPTPAMVRTGTKTLEKMDGAKEAPTAEAAAIAVTVAETRRLQNMHLKET